VRGSMITYVVGDGVVYVEGALSIAMLL